MAYYKFLSKSGLKEFESAPEFDGQARKQFFRFPKDIMDIVDNMRGNETNTVCFLLAYGYFKATRRFFPNQFRKKDINFVAKLIGVDKQLIHVKQYDRRQFSRHKKTILQYFGYSAFDSDANEQFIIEQTKLFTRSKLRPKLIFLNIIHALTQSKIEIPSYHRLSELIKQGLDAHNHDVTSNLENALTDDVKKMLDDLFKKDRDKKNINRITLLKKFSQSVKPAKIKRNIGYFLQLKSLYELIEPALKTLDLNSDGICYYATSVLKSQVFQIDRRNETDKYLHCLSFIAHQYYRLHDLLIDVLLAVCQSALNSSEREHARLYYENRGEHQTALSEFLNQSEQHSGVLEKIAAIIDTPKLTPSQKIKEIKNCLNDKTLDRKKYKSDLTDMRTKHQKNTSNEDYFDILESHSKKLQNRVSEIVTHVEFQADDPHNPTRQAIHFYKLKEGNLTPKAPLEFLDSHEIKIIHKAGKIRTSLYKLLLFMHLAKEIKSGRVNVKNSYRYRSLNDYLIPKQKWDAHREVYLKQAGLIDYASFELTLSKLQAVMDKQYQTTNDNISSGRNTYFKAKPDDSYVIYTPKVNKPELEIPLRDYFPEDDSISLTEILSSVQMTTDFLSELSHWQHKGHREKPHDRVFYAGLVGYGCQHGPNRIYKIARGVNGGELENTLNWYFTRDNINNSTDVLLKFMDKMALPNIYRKNKDELHTSSDGQKYEMLSDSLNANYSFKYLGKEKGVSIYSFIDERHITFYSTVISSSEREAHYAIDGLMMNDVVKSDIHSTDTHGYTNCIFGSMYLLGVTFAPRIKNLKKSGLYSFRPKSYYKGKDYALLPQDRIVTRTIKDSWDDILRFIATIKLKEATASQLFKRLNSYSEGHQLYDALNEFGKISKSIFILKYIDDVEFRQSIEKQLNKVENSNKFSKALAVGNTKGIPYATKEEQNLGEACKRFLKNALVCWNYMYMSQKIANEPDPEKRERMILAVKEGSIVTWGQFNFYGEYDFSDNKLRDSVGFNVSKILGLKLP